MGLFRRRYRIAVEGFEHLPRTGATLLLGNHISWIDWALVQIACPRPVRFVMLRSIYERWYLKPFLRAFGVIPIARGESEGSLQTVNALLRSGECVCLFPEGQISHSGHLGKFHTGFERAVAGVEQGVILPFYLMGLWGSAFSRADRDLSGVGAGWMRRNVGVRFGRPLPLATPAVEVKRAVFELAAGACGGSTGDAAGARGVGTWGCAQCEA